MRFIVAFLLLLFGPIGGLGGFVYAFGWATFLCVWKIADMVDDLKPKKGKTANHDRSP